jgi:hypothetical protein
MPGIDFARLRAEITMEQVLNQLGFEPVACLPQWGQCGRSTSSSPASQIREQIAGQLKF